MNNQILYEVNLAGWNDSFSKTAEANTPTSELLFTLTPTTKGVDAVVEHALRKIIDFSKIETALKQAPVAANASALGKTIAFLNSRVFGGAVNDVSAIEKLQKKEQGEIAQFTRLVTVRKLMAEKGMYLNYSGAYPALKGNLSEGKIQFIANYPGWQCIKKYAVTEKTDPRTLMEFLGSFSVSLENKMEYYIAQTVDVKKLDSFIASGPTGKTASDLEKTFAFLNGNELKQKINEVVTAAKLDKTHHEKMTHVLHAYANRKMLEPCKLFVKYSQVEIPRLKHLLKKKKE